MNVDESRAQQTSAWWIVGNVIGEHPRHDGEAESRHGTRLFRPNAKVYLADVHHWWNVLKPDKDESVRVLGQHRASRAWIVSYIRSTYVHNWRIRVVYQPTVLQELNESLPEMLDNGFAWEGDRDSRHAVASLLESWGCPAAHRYV